jgi:hypothetical protein
LTQSYLNKWGIRYYLPDFGPPVRWIASVPDFDAPELPALLYYECDADNLGMRAIYVYADGRVTLAYPGGPDGDSLPEGTLASVEECKGRTRGETREISQLEFSSIWAALSQAARDGAELTPLLDLTSSTDESSYAPFVGTWAPVDDTGMQSFLLFSLNGIVVRRGESHEFDLFRYHVENGIAFGQGAGSVFECEIVDSQLLLRVSGQEAGRFARVE